MSEKCDKCVHDLMSEPSECKVCIHNDMRILVDNFTTPDLKCCDEIISRLNRKKKTEKDIFPSKVVVMALQYTEDEAVSINEEIRKLRDESYLEGIAAAIREVSLERTNILKKNK